MFVLLVLACSRPPDVVRADDVDVEVDLLGREDCEGVVDVRFSWCEGVRTYTCVCRDGDCLVYDNTCPWFDDGPQDTGLFCCTECDGIEDNQVVYDICS